MAISPKRKRLLDAYRFPFFHPLEKIRGLFGDPKARVIALVRRSKNRLQCLWPNALWLVRQEAATGSRPF